MLITYSASNELILVLIFFITFSPLDLFLFFILNIWYLIFTKRRILLTGVAYSVFGINPLVVRVVVLVPNIESFKYQESHHVSLIQHDKHSFTI